MELRFPRLTQLAIILVCTPLMLVAGLLAMEPNIAAKVIGGFFFCGFGLGVGLHLLGLVLNRPVVEFSHVGIKDARTRLGVIPWNEIRALEIRKRRGLDHLHVYLQDPEGFLAQVRRRRRVRHARLAHDDSTVDIKLSDLRPSSSEVLHWLVRTHPDLIRDTVQTPDVETHE